MKFSGTAKQYKEFLKELKLKSSDIPYKFNTCKNCKYFNIGSSCNEFKIGECRKSPKAAFGHDGLLIMKADDFTTHHEDYSGRVQVGEDFGCIHFKKI